MLRNLVRHCLGSSALRFSTTELPQDLEMSDVGNNGENWNVSNSKPVAYEQWFSFPHGNGGVGYWSSLNLPAGRAAQEENYHFLVLISGISQNKCYLLSLYPVGLSRICFLERTEPHCAVLWRTSGRCSCLVQPQKAFLQGNDPIKVTPWHHKKSLVCEAAADYHWGANGFEFYSSCYLKLIKTQCSDEPKVISSHLCWGGECSAELQIMHRFCLMQSVNASLGMRVVNQGRLLSFHTSKFSFSIFPSCFPSSTLQEVTKNQDIPTWIWWHFGSPSTGVVVSHFWKIRFNRKSMETIQRLTHLAGKLLCQVRRKETAINHPALHLK